MNLGDGGYFWSLFGYYLNLVVLFCDIRLYIEDLKEE